MSYTKTTWRNNQAPAINADNLNHMEQGIESAHNQIDVNTSNIESLTTQVQNNATNIASEISARQTTDSSLQSQIDQLVAPTGEAPTPAEIENARIGDDGVTYDTLGNAIRGQFSDVKSDLSRFTDGTSYKATDGTYYSGTPIDVNSPSSNAAWESYAVPCTEGDTFVVKAYGGTSPRAWNFIDSNGVVLINEYQDQGGTFYVTAPENTAYLVVNNRKSSGTSFVITYPLADKVEKHSGYALSRTKSAVSGSEFSFLGAILYSFSNLKDKKVKLRYECDASIFPSGAYFLSGNGKYISGNADLYLPNTDYIIEVADTFAESGVTNAGLYAPASNVASSGSVTVYLYPIYDGSEDDFRDGVSKQFDELGAPLKKTLSGKTLWTLWDSLGHNTWQEYFVSDTNCEWDRTLNTLPTKPLSWGGSDSFPANDDGTQARAINLASYKSDHDIDVIIVENINDYNNMSNVGTPSDVPFMRSQKTVFDTGQTSYNNAVAYANSNLPSILANTASANRKKGSILSFAYTSGSAICGSKVTFNTGASASGNISIIWNGATYSVAVTAGMTPSEIAQEFAKYSFGAGVSDVASGNSITITYYTSSSMRATFNGGSTGVTATVTDAVGAGSYNLYFYGVGATDWTDTSKWSPSMTLYSVYKGLLAYMQTEFPEAKIYWATPWTAGVDFSSDTYKDESGAWSIDKFTLPYSALYDVQKEVCEMYSVPVLELDKKSGMSIINIETYFNSRNVHPKAVGYKKYADVMANMISILP